jgi:hypothetical protein
LYVPRKWGRRGLMKLEEAYTVEVMKVKEYVDSKKQTQQCYKENYREEQDKGQHSTEDKRKMAREENAWIFPS